MLFACQALPKFLGGNGDADEGISSRFNIFEKCVKSKIDFKDFPVSAVSLIEQTWTQQEFILAALSLSHGTP